MNDVEKKFLLKINNSFSSEEVQLIKYALEFSKKKHESTFRLTGEPFYLHPIETANILLEYGFDSATLCAALLHDILEDTDSTEEEMRTKFGEEITLLIVSVTKLSKIKFKSKEEEQAENFRKLFFSIAQDIRVLFIKLADRLHNMRTLYALPKDKQKRIAKETMEIYAPIASRIGLYVIKSELEDLCFQYLYSEDFMMLSDLVKRKMPFYQQMVSEVIKKIDVELKKSQIIADLQGRPKHLYSIFKKMKLQNKEVDEITDLVAVRIIVNTIGECYSVIGIIHSMWKPLPGRFKDYIAIPKQNSYQSLHTTVMSEFAQKFEVQIRTFEMHKIAEYGLAAHWMYKEGSAKGSHSTINEKFGWIQEVLETESELKDSIEYLNDLKLNISTDEVYVFTPKGDVFALPNGSTGIDFAYKIHSEIGNKCVGIKINDRIVPIHTQLETGDMVEVLTNKASKGPSRDWLKFVVSPQAKSKIKAFFKKSMKEENIKLGKELMEREAKRRGYSLSDLLSIDDSMKYLTTKYSLTSIDDLYAAIGYGGLSPTQVLLKLIDKYQKHNAILLTQEEDAAKIASIISKHPKKAKATSGILIEGIDNLLMRLSKCCNPLPGDEIVGYAARGTGVSIHRKDCPNVKSMEKTRILQASWTNGNTSDLFTAKIRIEAIDKAGLLHSITHILSTHKISIDNLVVHKQANNKTIINLWIQIKTTDELNFVISKLEKIDNIISIVRPN